MERHRRQPEIGAKAQARLLVEHLLMTTAGTGVAIAAVVFAEPWQELTDLAPLSWLLGVVILLQGVGVGVARSLARRTLGKAPGEPWLQLPGRLAIIHLVAWLVVGLSCGVGLLAVNLYRVDRSFMLLLACGLSGVATALAARVRATLVLAPALAAAGGLTEGQVPTRTTLKRRLTLVLGGIVFFSSAFGLFAVFAVQREVVGQHVQQKCDEVRRAALSMDRAAAPCQALARLLPDGAVLYWNDGERTCRAGPQATPELAEILVAAPAGPLTVPSLDLEGRRFALDDAADSPVLTVLMERPEWTRRVLLVSLAFYTLLFLFSAYLAAQIARSLTRPIESLRQQLAAIERGELGEPVGRFSADEIGQLALSADAMRRGLATMVKTIQELNVGLEEKVADRTRQLAVANDDLTGALDRLKEAQGQLVHSEKMASLGRLMTGLAHELNNPVNAVLNTIGPMKRALDRLEGQVDGGELGRLSRAAATIERGAQRTVELIQSMGTFSRAGEQVRKPFDLNAAVDATWLLLQHRVDEQHCRVTQSLASLPDVIAVPGEISQVLMNLFSNALDAVAPLKSAGEVTVTTSLDGHQICVAVDDNGEGVPEDERPRIFEPFYTNREEGTGLGLAISDEVARRHQGTLTVTESPAGGARFVLCLPMDDAPLEPGVD